MLVNLLPEKTGKILSDNGSTVALTTGQKAALIDGVEGAGGITFGALVYGSNILTGGTPSVSDYYNASMMGDKAVDGNLSTYWNTQTLYPPHWWKYQLAVAKTVTKLTIQCGHIYGLKNFTLDGSNDGSSWTTVYTGLSAQVTTQQVFTFANTTAYLYYRVYGSDEWGAGNGHRIVEYQMFESTIGSLNFKLDITGGGNAPIHEARYFTTDTDTTKVTIKTSTDGISWTTQTTVAGGAGYLKAVIAAAVRHVSIDHAGDNAPTSYEIEAFTQRCPRPELAGYNIMNYSRRTGGANYNVVYSHRSVKSVASAYSVFQPVLKLGAANYQIRQATAKRETVSYRVLQAVVKRWDARYRIRPPAPLLLSASDMAVAAILAGLLKTGAVSAEIPFHLWNSRGGGAELMMGNIRITTTLDNGKYSGGSYPQGQEIVTGKWVELKSAGVVGIGIQDDAQAGFTAVGGDPAAGGLTVGPIPANSGRVITMRINVPASPATAYAAMPRLAINYDVLDVAGFGSSFGTFYGG